MEQTHFLNSKHSQSQLDFEIFAGFAARLLTLKTEESTLSRLRVIGVSPLAFVLWWILAENGQKRLE